MSEETLPLPEHNDLLAEAVRSMSPLDFGGLSLTLYYCIIVLAKGHFLTREHAHPTYEMTIHLDGEPIHTYIGRATVSLSKGCGKAMFLPPSQLHSRRQITEGESKIISFSFGLNGRGVEQQRLCQQIEDIAARHGYVFPLTSLQMQMISALASLPPDSLFRTSWIATTQRCFLTGFLTWNFPWNILQQDGGAAVASHEIENEIVTSICLSLNTKKLSLQELSRMYGLGIRQLSRRFRERYGCSIGRYQQQVRLKNAKALLETTDRSITDIAYTAGFPNVQAFSRFFQKYEGVSPSEYRIEAEKHPRNE
ncbi:MAG: helix-turn-helix transcriptional regulator [Victivallales bacterium]|nr:helix-turn-helix transcriptional regulator [Victivallales bacterium]